MMKEVWSSQTLLIIFQLQVQEYSVTQSGIVNLLLTQGSQLPGQNTKIKLNVCEIPYLLLILEIIRTRSVHSAVVVLLIL